MELAMHPFIAKQFLEIDVNDRESLMLPGLSSQNFYADQESYDNIINFRRAAKLLRYLLY
jgi:hypothetical protein